MNSAEAVEALNAMNKGDAEASHGEADEILLRVLRAHGLTIVAQAWEDARERIGFWYA